MKVAERLNDIAARLAAVEEYIEKDKERRHGERPMAELTRNLHKSTAKIGKSSDARE